MMAAPPPGAIGDLGGAIQRHPPGENGNYGGGRMVAPPWTMANGMLGTLFFYLKMVLIGASDPPLEVDVVEP